MGERLHKVLGQINLGTLDSGERSLPFGLLVLINLPEMKLKSPWFLFETYHVYSVVGKPIFRGVLPSKFCFRS